MSCDKSCPHPPTHLFLLVAEQGAAVHDAPAAMTLATLPPDKVATSVAREGGTIGGLGWEAERNKTMALGYNAKSHFV